MLRIRTLSRLVALSALAVGCKTSHAYDRANDPGGKPVGTTTMGSVILTGRSLTADPGRTVLDAIRNSMPQLRVTGWTPYTRCPMLELRGRDSMQGSNDPDVYVDGTRTNDTCPLVTIQAISTERVEVYPLGMTARPGYPSSGHGLILIFLARADGSPDTTGSAGSGR
jgi:hypothetical protein